MEIAAAEMGKPGKKQYWMFWMVGGEVEKQPNFRFFKLTFPIRHLRGDGDMYVVQYDVQKKEDSPEDSNKDGR